MDAEDRVVREGSPWLDRVTRAAGVMPATGHSTTAGDAELAAWRRVVDPDGAGLFARRLEWDGLDEGATQVLSCR